VREKLVHRRRLLDDAVDKTRTCDLMITSPTFYD